jgi:hypothetical protein
MSGDTRYHEIRWNVEIRALEEPIDHINHLRPGVIIAARSRKASSKRGRHSGKVYER